MLNKEETAAIQAVVETADGWWPLRGNPGMFESEIYADYRDELPEDEAIEILESENPVETFNNKMFDWYQDEWDRIQNELIDSVIEKLEESGSEEDVAFWENHEDDVRSWVYEHTTVKLPCDHYLDEDVFINIFVDTGDGNYDFSLNAVFPSYAGRKEDRIDEKASILWLARQQGFTKTKLWKALRYGDKTKTPGFLRSMRQEVVNISSHMNILTFLVKVTLRNPVSRQPLRMPIPRTSIPSSTKLLAESFIPGFRLWLTRRGKTNETQIIENPFCSIGKHSVLAVFSRYGEG